MSRWNDKADRIATYLASQPELRWIPVSVHRDDNLLQLVFRGFYFPFWANTLRVQS
jgi:hypothetical protein